MQEQLTEDEFNEKIKNGELKQMTPEEEIKLRSLVLSNEDFNKCRDIALKLTNFKIEPNYVIEKEIADLWFAHTHKEFKNAKGPTHLHVREGDESLLPFHLWAIKLDTNKPYIFLFLDDEKAIMIDERRFDAFDRGPFIKPE